MKRQSVFVFFALVIVAVAGWFGYSALEKRDAQSVQSSSASTVSDTQNPASASQTLTQTKGFRYDGWKVDNGSELPKACLQFTQDMDNADGLKIIDYIRTTPETKLTADISGKSVCLSGLKFGQDYQLTLLKGLQSQKDAALKEDKTIEISFGDRPPYVAFRGNGVILPRIGAQGLAIETVNIDMLDIEIFRVGDRMMARRSPQTGRATPEGGYSYEYSDAATDIRQSIWKGTLPIKSSPNTLTTTILPLNDLVGELKPGAYIVNAGRTHGTDDYRTAKAWRWIISTDLAMTTYQSEDGLDVSLRSIDTAQPVKKARVDLVAYNNEILSSAVSNSKGRVHFARALLHGQNTNRPRMLMAYGTNGDYAVLDFNRSPLDLSAFAIGGRQAHKDIDAYVFTDRGVYRPGETVHLTAMLRGKMGRAVSGRNGQIRFTKPNGIEFSTVRFEDTLEGTLLQNFTVPSSAPRGVWRAFVEVDGMGRVGNAEFSVEDFAPQKLRVDINIDNAPIRKTGVRTFEVSAQFLYGANGAGLSAEGEARIRVDPKPFPSLKDYSFGKADESFREIFMDLGGGTTDGEGILELGINLAKENIKTSHPLRAEITVGTAEPGGRYVKNSARVPVRTNDVYIGMKPDFDGRVERNKPFSFNVKAVDWQGQTVSLKGVEWVLVEEDWHYNWYRQYGSWRYRREIRDIERARGSVDIDASTGIDLSHTLNWGDYRLMVRDKQSGAESAYRFSVGWGGSSSSDAPDQVQIGVPSGNIKGGDTITLTVKAPYAGIGELVLANDKVQSIRTVQIPQGGSEISVKLDKNMGAGVYALLTVYTPRSVDARPVPRRAVGIGYIALDVSKQKMELAIQTPDVVRPNRKQNIKIKFANVPRGEKVWMTLAAIDEGVLQVTKYKSPDPQKWYFGKKSLNVDVRDDYARLLNPNLGLAAIANSGGDSLGGEGLTATPIKVVSLYSGPVTVKSGTVTIQVDLPEFNGELRLMAVAWSKSALGSDSRPMKVRDPVPALLALPRFMAPGDRAIATVSLDNVDGRAGKYGVSLSGTNNLSIDDASESVELAKGERKSVTREILASQTGVSEVGLTIKGPRNYKVESLSNLQTRNAFLPITRMVTARMNPGQSYTLDPRIMQGLELGTVDVNISFANAPNLDPSAYAASVSRYPYGCTEQTISAALPLLYANDLGGVAGMGPLKAREGVQTSIDRILNRQGHDGAFGLWSEGDGYASPWIGVYATDFLQRTKDEEYVVNADALNKSYTALKKMTKMEKYPSLSYRYKFYNDNNKTRETRQAEAAAYAHYVLARAGKADLGDMRYFYDNHAKKMNSPLAWGHIGAALVMMDDGYRSQKAFATATQKLGYSDENDYYQTPLRDAAGLMSLVNEVDAVGVLQTVQNAFDESLKPPNQLHTQEKAQTILAIRSFLVNSKPVNIVAPEAELQSSKGITKAHLYGADLVNSVTFTNESDVETWRSVMVTGSPLQAPVPTQKGFVVSKNIFTMTGKLADLSAVQKGEKFIVRVRFSSTITRSRQAVLADLLPAGMEVETILTQEDGAQQNGQKGAFSWLGQLSAFQTQEMRDDRVVAVADTYRKDQYAIAYIVRAVTAGDFVWPGAVVQDMYRPADQSNTKTQRVVITSGNRG